MSRGFSSFVILFAAGFCLAKYFANVLWGLYWLVYQVPREWKKVTQKERESKTREE